ncbi:MAG: SurA N-terminal domain-containing protein [Akkermansiaceae bacterium]
MTIVPSRFFVTLVFTILPISNIIGQKPPPTTDKIKPAGSRRIMVNRIVAKVNGEVITQNQLKLEVASTEAALKAQFPGRGPAFEKQLEQIRERALNEMIDRAIIFSEFKDRISIITDQQVEEEIKRIVDRLYNGDEELFKEYLKNLRVTRDQFKQQQKREILVQIVRTQHFGDVPEPRESELREAYKTWKIANRDRSKDKASYRVIRLTKSKINPEIQLKLAEQIKERLDRGADFSDLAKQYSDDSKASIGGLWEDYSRLDLIPIFANLIFETEGNQLLGPLDAGFAYSIIRVEKRTLGPSPSFEEARDQLKYMVVAEKKKGNFERWMKKMRSRAAIDKPKLPGRNITNR